MPPVFGHGQLRLYLLAVLADGPRSGYDVIRGLEDRFAGLYAPSAGTVYPRLAKLEEEGLVERTDEGRRSTYALTPAGRAELASRAGELDAVEERLDASADRLARDMRRRVAAGADDLRARLDAQARQARSDAAELDDETGDGGPDRSWEQSEGSRGSGAGPSGAPGEQDWAQLAGWLRSAAAQVGVSGDLAEQARRLGDLAGAAGSRSWSQAGARSQAGAGSQATSWRWGDLDLSWLEGASWPPSARRAEGPGERAHRSSADLWAQATDVPEATGAGAGAGAGDAGSGSAGADDPWSRLGGSGLPDAAQLAAIAVILRDAAERIQRVLKADGPPPGAG